MGINPSKESFTQLLEAAQVDNQSLALCMNICKWLAIIRGFCVVESPIVIYTRLRLPDARVVNKTTYQINVPIEVSNILVDILSDLTAREAELCEEDKEILYQTLELPGRGPGKLWKLGLQSRYEITRVCPVRLGTTLSDMVTRSVWPLDAESSAFRLTSTLLAQYYRDVSCRDDVKSAPLTRSEWVWMTRTIRHKCDMIGGL